MKTVYSALAGLCLFIVANGINRFSYGPIIPYMVNAHWVSSAEGGYIGAANFFGYFLGALFATKLSRKINLGVLMITLLLASSLFTALSAIEFNAVWLGFLRLSAGFFAGVMMVFIPTVTTKGIEAKAVPLVTSISFSGVGLGVLLTSLWVPWFGSHWSVSGIWVGFALLSFCFTLISLPKCLLNRKVILAYTESKSQISKRKRLDLLIIAISVGLYGIGLTPSLLFLPEYIHRNLHATVQLSSHIFSIVGLGCALGAVLAGWSYSRIGSKFSIILVNLFGIGAIGIVLLWPNIVTAALSALFIGIYMLAFLVLVSLLIRDMVGDLLHAKSWSLVVYIYALSQFAAGMFLSYLLSLNFGYSMSFLIGVMAICLSLGCYAYMWCRR